MKIRLPNHFYLTNVLICLMAIFCSTYDVHAQWTTSGSDITNSNAGNVGIGITPTAKLHVNGALKIEGSNQIELGNGITKEISAGMIAYQRFSDGVDIVGAGLLGNNRKLKFWAEGGSVFTGSIQVVGDGNFGSPGYGMMKVGGDDGTYLHVKTTTNDRSLRLSATSDALYELNRNGAFGWYSFGTWKMYMLPNGNVGIGTVNPDAKLSVNGKIKAKEIEVTVNIPGDYVFEKNYNLMPLSEVEKYVNTQKHLPNIPSAAELKENGYNIGDMSNNMMVKIEELTLYMIELKKENEALRKANEDLNRRLMKVEGK